MRILTIAALIAMLSLPACAQTEPIDDVHATPTHTPEPAPPEQAARSWRRVLPESVRADRLRDLTALIAEEGGVSIDDVFDDAFYAHTPRERLEQTLAEARELASGSLSFVRVLVRNDEVLGVELADATGAPWTAAIALAEGSDRVVALELQPLPPRAPGQKVYDTWNEVLADVRTLEGDVSFAVRRVGTAGLHAPIALHHADEARNVAQLGQLYVFRAVADAVDRGTLSWEDEIAMEEKLRSLPPSQYAQSEDGRAYTLREYLIGAGALRDSAAADALLHAVGRELVRTNYERLVDNTPAHAFPWLSVRDYALLKLFSSDEGRERYAGDDEEARTATLARVPGDADLSVDQQARIASWTTPRSVDRVGWFASADDLVRVIAELAEISATVDGMQPIERALLANNGTPLSSEVWPVQVFKAGGEPGVFALATLLRRADGAFFATVMVLNDSQRLPDWQEAQRIALGAIDLLAIEQ
ncbi:MAG: serine hydrolase [Planctomycetota bacterium]